MNDLKRRDFLKASAAFAGAAEVRGFRCIEIASAAPIEVPTIDKLTMRVLIDQAHDSFLRGSTVKGVVHDGPGPGRSADARNVLHNQWGLSLYLQSQRDQEQRTIMLDFGYTAPALINNIGLMNVDPSKIKAMVVSHGHIDHYGGLIGFLGKYRNVLPAEVKLYAGGEDNFCHRFSGSDAGAVRRERHARSPRDRRAQGHDVLCETPTVIAGHAFTTGKIKRNSIERVLPNSFVDTLSRRARLRRRPLHGGGDAGQDRAGRARARARDLLQHPRQGSRGDQLLRSRRHRQFGAAGAGSLRHPEGARDRRRLPSRAGARGLPQAGGRGDQEAGAGRAHPDALQRRQFLLEVRAQMPDSVIVTSTGGRMMFGA